MSGGLSDSERTLIEWLEQNNRWHVTTDQITSVLSCSFEQAHHIGFTLCLKKWLVTLSKNHYILQKSFHSNTPSIHPLIIGSYLIDPYYYSFSTAAAHHRLIPPTQETIYLVTTAIRNNPEINGVFYRFIHVTPRKFFGYTTVQINKVTVNMADKEKTFVDCLDKSKYLGGLTQVIQLLKNNIQTLDVQRLVDYTVLMGSSTLIQRIGYILDHLQVSFDEEFLRSYSLGVLTYLDPMNTYDQKPRRNEKWNLMVNIPDSFFRDTP
jgi:predicted transcriptional regulator of viral defense system